MSQRASHTPIELPLNQLSHYLYGVFFHYIETRSFTCLRENNRFNKPPHPRRVRGGAASMWTAGWAPSPASHSIHWQRRNMGKREGRRERERKRERKKERKEGRKEGRKKERERKRSEERRVGKECRSRWSPYH